MSKPGNRFKAIIRQVHLYLGLVSGLVVLVVALTGCLYVFEEECRDIFQHKYYYTTAQGTRKDLAELQQAVKQAYPSEKITTIRFKEKANAVFIFSTKSRKAISVDPYTGAVIGSRDMEKDFFGIVLKIHRTLWLGETGKEIIKWNVLIFFILCVSGLILWWPKQKRFFKQAASIRFKRGNWKRVNRDLHTVPGFYALLLLMLISLTGMFWMFDSVKDGVRFVTNQKKSKKEEKIKSRPAAGAVFATGEAYRYMVTHYTGAEETFISVPADSLAPIRVLQRYPYTLVRKQVSLYFDQYSGNILKQEHFDQYTAYDKVARANYSLHTGDIPPLGIGSKIIYFLASLIAASLPVTGFLVWLGKKRKKIFNKNNMQRMPQLIPA